MSTERFNVVLNGTTLRGLDVATVAAELAKLIKRDTALAVRLLRGQPTNLKSGIEAAAAARYIEALERIGVSARLEPESLEIDADLAAPAKADQWQTSSPTERTGPSGENFQSERQSQDQGGNPATISAPSGEWVQGLQFSTPGYRRQRTQMKSASRHVIGSRVVATFLAAIVFLVSWVAILALSLGLLAVLGIRLPTNNSMGAGAGLLAFSLALTSYKLLRRAKKVGTVDPQTSLAAAQARTDSPAQADRASSPLPNPIKQHADLALSLPGGEPTEPKCRIEGADAARGVDAFQSNGPTVLVERRTASIETDGEVTIQTFYKAWIGAKGQSFYLNYFSKAERKAERNEGFVFSWHWPACFATLGWFLYRKLYLQATVYLVVAVAVGGVASYELSVSRLSGNVTQLRQWELINIGIWVLYFVLPAVLANGIYYRHVFSKMKAARTAHRDTTNQLREAAVCGGTSWLPVVIGLTLYLAVAALAPKAFDAYDAYVLTAEHPMVLPETHSTGIQPRVVQSQVVPAPQPQLGSADDQGDPAAQTTLGLRYEQGRGVPQDYVQAMKWYRKAADRGHADAQFNIGVMYDKGNGVHQDLGEAMKWYRKEADKGDAEAQFNLGVMYANGEGVPRDYAAAMEWYGKSADRGHADAQFNIGLMYDQGHGVNQDPGEAMKWYRRAADHGQADAQNNVGSLYEDGRGVPRDLVQAHKWYSLALARFSASEKVSLISARNSLSRVAAKMTQAQIAAAQTLAREWKPG